MVEFRMQMSRSGHAKGHIRTALPEAITVRRTVVYGAGKLPWLLWGCLKAIIFAWQLDVFLMVTTTFRDTKRQACMCHRNTEALTSFAWDATDYM